MKFKLGDEVEIKKVSNLTNLSRDEIRKSEKLIGSTGKIVDIDENYEYPYELKFDGKTTDIIFWAEDDLELLTELPSKVKEALDKAFEVGYTKYSVTNFVGMEKDFPELYAILQDYFFNNHEKYLKAVLYN